MTIELWRKLDTSEIMSNPYAIGLFIMCADHVQIYVYDFFFHSTHSLECGSEFLEYPVYFGKFIKLYPLDQCSIKQTLSWSLDVENC